MNISNCMLMTVYRIPHDDDCYLDDGVRSFRIIYIGDEKIGRHQIVFCDESDSESKLCFAMRYTLIDEDVVLIESLKSGEPVVIAEALRRKGFTDPIFDYFGVYRSAADGINTKPYKKRAKRARIEILYDTGQAMRAFLKQNQFYNTARLMKRNGSVGYITMDCSAVGSNFIIMKMDLLKRKLYIDYYSNISFHYRDNTDAYRLIEYINSRLNDASVLVTESNELLYRGIIDLNDASASVSSIQRVYECFIFITLFFGSLLEECLQYPKESTDYLEKAMEQFREAELLGEKGIDYEDEDISDFFITDNDTEDDGSFWCDDMLGR